MTRQHNKNAKVPKKKRDKDQKTAKAKTTEDNRRQRKPRFQKREIPRQNYGKDKTIIG